jgi:hypothetical protein
VIKSRKMGGVCSSGGEMKSVTLDGIVVIVLAVEPNVRGFKPGRGWWNFKGFKNP